MAMKAISKPIGSNQANERLVGCACKGWLPDVFWEVDDSVSKSNDMVYLFDG